MENALRVLEVYRDTVAKSAGSRGYVAYCKGWTNSEAVLEDKVGTSPDVATHDTAGESLTLQANSS